MEVNLYGRNYETLTESEGRTILVSKELDSARDRILAARQERSKQILQRSVQGREATEITGPPVQNDSQNTQQGRPDGGPDLLQRFAKS